MKSKEDVSTFGSLSPARGCSRNLQTDHMPVNYLPKLKPPHAATVHQGWQGLNVVLDLFLSVWQQFSGQRKCLGNSFCLFDTVHCRFSYIFINLFTVRLLREYSCRNMLFNLFFSLLLTFRFARFYKNRFIPLGFKSSDFDQSYTGVQFKFENGFRNHDINQCVTKISNPPPQKKLCG